VAIDDFGVGHASLAYLRRLPCDVIKLDRSFVRGMSTNRTDRIIVSSTIVLAHSLRLRVVAEGVGDADAWTRLRILGCNEAQGHFIAPALPGDEVQAWLAEWEQRRLTLQALRRRRSTPPATQAPSSSLGQESAPLPSQGPGPLSGQAGPATQALSPNGQGSPKPSRRPARVRD
jgi:predicted signal transduction protein with EAL and GGDEF domain